MFWKILATTLACFIAFLFRFITQKTNGTGSTPPGPRGIPFLGNLFQLDIKKPWCTFAKWKEIYGPIVYINIVGRPILILSSKKVAEDLLEHRALKYSSRPRLIVAEKVTSDSNVVLLQYGERWRKMRRASENALGIKISQNYHGIQSSESILLAQGILTNPDSWNSQIERASSSVALSIVYDFPSIQSLDDPSLLFIKSFTDFIAKAAMPGTYLVDVFPILEGLPRWCDLSNWRQCAEREFKRANDNFEQMFGKIKNRFLSGHEQRASFCLTLSENQSNHNMSDNDCAWLSGMLYDAAQETTATTMMWFIFAMILFPDIQQRAQNELDSVVGRSRFPSFADAKHLPYTRAILKEILRWRPAVAFGVPHTVDEDDYYDGYFIPKGTMCFPNTWSINRDPEVYGSDADDFRPERHLDEHGNLRDEKSEGHFTYGFGHRICVGRHVANNSLFLEMATILWTMRLEPKKNANGDFVRPDIDAVEVHGLIIRPPPFEIEVIPRFQDADTMIQQARDEIIEENFARSNVQ